MQSLRLKNHAPQHYWKIRNDSTNVANALHSRCNGNKPCRQNRKVCSSGSRPGKSSNHKQNETCYCQRSPVRTKLNLKPKLDRFYTTEQSENRRSSSYFSQTRESTCSASGRPFVKSNRVDGTCYTLTKVKNSKPTSEDESETIDKKDEKSPLNDETGKNLKDLNTFRNDNYFDCHSTQNLTAEITDHKCLHKFVLNNRLIPEPLNCDAFGTSRCVHCNQPMIKETPEPLKKGNYKSLMLKKNKQNKYTKSVSLTKNTGTTEIEIPNNFNKFVELFENAVDNLKKVQPSNSIALRHQKGVHLG